MFKFELKQVHKNQFLGYFSLYTIFLPLFSSFFGFYLNYILLYVFPLWPGFFSSSCFPLSRFIMTDLYIFCAILTWASWFTIGS